MEEEALAQWGVLLQKQNKKKFVTQGVHVPTEKKPSFPANQNENVVYFFRLN